MVEVGQIEHLQIDAVRTELAEPAELVNDLRERAAETPSTYVVRVLSDRGGATAYVVFGCADG